MIHKHRQYYWWIFILLSFWGGALGAAQNIGALYQATVPVAGQGAEERRTAFLSALTEVVSRVGGRNINLPPSQRAAELVARYNYASGSDGLRLVVDFEPEAIGRLLGKHRMPVWGARRPATLVWLVAREEDGVMRLIGSNGPSPHHIPLQEEAKRRGVPLVWPIMDLLENARQPLPEGKESLVALLRGASRNYPVEAILIGRLASVPTKINAASPEKNSWAVHWTLLRGNKEEQWNTSGAESNVALKAGINQLGEHLSGGPGSASDAPIVQHQTIAVVVAGVASLENYAQLRKLLEGLPEIINLWPTHFSPEGRLRFTIEPRRNVSHLAAALRQTGMLRANELPIDLSERKDATLYYYLIK